MRQRSFLFLFLVLGLALISGFFYTQKKYQLGLDVKGGVRLVYQMDTSQLSAEQKKAIATVRANILHILENRATGGFGATESTVSQKGDDQFIIELPGFTNLSEAESVLGTSAKIKFYGARNVIGPKTQFARFRAESVEDPENPIVNFTKVATGEKIEYLIDDPAKPGQKIVNPAYQDILKEWGDPILEGDDLAKAEVELSHGPAVPMMNFSSKGSEKMRRWSAANPQGNLAIVLDGKVLSYASVKEGQTLSDSCFIDGKFDPQWVKSLVDLLNSGALPVDLKKLSSEKVDPTIGKTALDKMVTAGLISFGIISLFLMVYYSFPGIVAFVALVLYILFTITALKLINATFSLAAIAGFILSVGMAVDANILVFERFKEEMKKGKDLHKALNLGFSRALPAILDSNACTILTSLVLLNLGTGPVKGFATTLVIGVVISFFTAVAVTRSLLVFFVDSGIAKNPKWYAMSRNWFGEKFEAVADTDPLPVVQKSKRWFAISIATIIPGLLFIGLGGIKPNVEFRGGSEIQYAVSDANLTSVQLLGKLEEAGFKGANVKFGTGADNAKIAYLTIPPSEKLDGVGSDAEAKVKQVIGAATGLPDADFKGFTQIGPTVQKETLNNAIMGVVVSSILIIVYLAIRFGVNLGNFVAGLRFGFSAIIALVHDILVVIGVAAIVGYLVGWEVSALSITAMLTIIGFSVHDTIVIFDRIRENLRRPQSSESFEHLINRSISRSFARSINTSMTVIVTLMIIFFAGTTTPDLKFFILAMLVGIISGTYSSIYNASPILYLWDKAVQKRKGDQATLIGLAIHEAAKATVITTKVNSPVADPVEAKTKQYGQVRRRANEPNKRNIDIED